MKYYLEVRFEDINYNARIYFALAIKVHSEEEAKTFHSEIISAFERRKVAILHSCYEPILQENEFLNKHNLYLENATHYIDIDQFHMENPDQNKSLYENLVEKVFTNEDSVAEIGNKFKIPVRVIDKEMQTPITDEIYYFSLQHLIPKN